MAKPDVASRRTATRPNWLFLALALACLVLGAWLRFWSLDFGLPHPGTRPDERPVLDLTVLAAQGNLEFDWSNYPHAYVYLHWLWGELTLRAAALLNLVPSGDYARVWRSDPGHLYLLGRGLSASLGVVTIGFVIAATKRAFGSVTAILAGLWLAVNLLHVRDSHALKPDVLLALAIQLCLIASVRLAEAPTARRGAIAGLTVGFAAAAKYNGVLAAIPVMAASWLGSRGHTLRTLWVPLFIAGGCSIAFFLATSPYLLTNDASQEMLRHNLHAVFPTWIDAPPEGLRTNLSDLDLPSHPDWVHRYGALSGFLYHPTFSLRHGVGLGATLLFPIAVLWGLRSRVLLARLSAIFVTGWLVTISLSPVLLSRYVTPALPAIAILEAGAVVTFLRRFAPNHVGALTSLAALALCTEPLIDSIQLNRLLAMPDSRVQATEWLAEHIQPRERTLIVGTRFWGWGEPALPPPARRVELHGRKQIDPRVADWVVAHDHELFWSDTDRALLRRSRPWLELRAEFDPNAPRGPAPVFERNDAWYVPISGFSGVFFPGPRVEIYRVRKAAPRGAGAR
jgi:hypothetical protein